MKTRELSPFLGYSRVMSPAELAAIVASPARIASIPLGMALIAVSGTTITETRLKVASGSGAATLPIWPTSTSGPTYGAGTLAARPLAPNPGDGYIVTSGPATGDRYLAFSAGAWSLVDYNRSYVPSTPWARWNLDEAAGNFLNTGSGGAALDLTPSGNIARRQRNGQKFGMFSFNGGIGSGATLAPTGTRRATISIWRMPKEADAFAASQFSLSFCHNPYVAPEDAIAVGCVGAGGATATFRCRIDLGGAQETLDASLPFLPSLNLWHLAVTWDGDDGTAKLRGYFNGEQVVQSSPAGTDIDWDVGQWVISGNPASQWGSGFNSEGLVYDNEALTAAQIREIYQRGVGSYAGV